MKLIVLGLSLSSSWGNGHATTFRGLLKAFAERGHEVLFLERDVPWYRGEHRDLPNPGFCGLRFYDDLADLKRFTPEVASADAVLVGSFVPDGVAVGAWAQATAAGPVAFYDIDTPVTLAKLERGDAEYLSRELISGYDVYFSFTGGPTLARLEQAFGSPAARALYCAVDPEIYRPMAVGTRWDLSYLGTYSDDRQPVLERLMLEAARRAPGLRCCVAGPQYPANIDWPANVERIEHVPPAEHPRFYAQSRFTLNVTRADMVRAGWSPSVRLFEAGACGTPVISDLWPGLEEVFALGQAIIPADGPEAVLDALMLPADQARAIGKAARAAVLAAHTPTHRAETLERELIAAATRRDAEGVRQYA